MDIQPNQRIYDVVKIIKQDGFKIPNIQRGYEWDTDRIIKLFDSVMRGYPIGALMIWNPPKDVLEEIRARKFVDNYDPAADYLTDTVHPGSTGAYFLVLDGQQRLQSLFLGFFGSYNGERLYFKSDYVLTESAENENYAFEFLTADEAKERPEMVHISDIININNKTKFDFVKKLLEKLTANIEDKDTKIAIHEDKQAVIHQNIDLFIEKFNIIQSLLFEIVEKDLDYESVLEVFERVNSGGMVLSRSDLLFCTLKLKMQEMEEKFTDTINSINHGYRYNFDTDFIIKASLVIFDQKAEYSVKKLKDEAFVAALRTRYDQMSTCLRQLLAWVEDVAKIKCSRFLRSKAALIPILDYMMQSGKHDKPEGPNSNFMKEYLYMSFFRRLFSRGQDAVLDQMHNIISEEVKKDKAHFPIEKIREFMVKRQKLPYIIEEHYYNTDAELILNIVDGGVFQIDPADPKAHSKDLKLEVDHIFPRTPLTRDFGIADKDVDHLGNYRLVVLPINRRKNAKVPTESMSFYGDKIGGIESAYNDAIKSMESKSIDDFRKDFIKFRDGRYNEIKRDIKEFLPI
ncbi:MAG: DUF262 domain-containing protein [Candidatus Omnitrophota bacterium]|nr:DUF262 domain-containing protein [Candidatus Omnitrophota bacterium]